MDDSRFDDFTRSVATSRRKALRLLLGASVAALLPFERGAAADFRVRPFRRVGKRCDHGQPCGFLAPCRNGVCTPIVCLIEDQIYQPTDFNPDNPCQFCLPTVDGWNTWLGTVGDGEACAFDSQIPCQSAEGVCQNVECIRDFLPDASECGVGGTCCSGVCCEDGNCCCIDGQSIGDGTLQTPGGCLSCNIDQSITEWTVLDDGSACGGVSGRVCCNAECCSPTECCNGAACEECGPHCHIGTEDVGAGIEHPDNECEVCDPERDFDSWSLKDPGSPCGLSDLQECCFGTCCPLGQCCHEGSCGSCFCLIEGDEVPDGEAHPTDKCLKCIYDQHPDAWSPQPNNSRCGSGDDRLCCEGACCPNGQCCTLDGCTDCACFIGEEPVAEGQAKPGNTCETCQSNRDRFDWTPLDDGDACGPSGNSECCNGACCPEGQCCENGACQRCPCEIGTDTVAADVVNIDNPCQKCIPELNRFGWSPVAEGTACGDDLTGACCGGDCCPDGQCCLLEACGECLCAIGEDTVAAETPHPTIDCLECKPELDPFGWSTADDGDACGDTGSQQCCSGGCCPEGECCIDGDCHPCDGCVIDGADVAAQDENPDNECQICDPSRDPLGWSPRDEGTPCGEADELCCKAGVCTLCGCLIEGVPYDDGRENPLNECEQCDLALDAVRWTPRNETFSCGASDTQLCCNGVCCPPGHSCNLEDVCEPRPCEIDGATVEPFQHNPQDLCQLCDPATSTTAWSIAPDGDPCGPNLDQTCCAGVCGCEPGCIIDGVHYDDGQPRPGNFSCEACNAAFPDVWSPRFHPDCPPPCQLDGALIPYGTPNPQNPCQICLGGDVWSPSDVLYCGEGGGQNCCNGVCCEPGACCTADGTCGFDACEPEGCVIDGAQYENFARNPVNECEACLVDVSKTSWSPDGFGSCGPAGAQFCCGGVCCDLGVCCNLATVGCDPEQCRNCVIGGAVYLPGERNPANGCEVCNDTLSETSWSLADPNNWCDDSQSAVCCGGTCCNPGAFCNIQLQCQV